MPNSVQRTPHSVQQLQHDLQRLNVSVGTRTLTSIENIPQELIDSIIDHLERDKAALQACSLVCRAWHSRSQQHLFSSLVVGPPQDNIDPIQPFIESLQNNPHLAALVKELLLKGQWSAQLRVCPETIATIMNNLPNLKTLRLHGVDTAERDRPFIPPRRFQLDCLAIVWGITYEECTVIECIVDVLSLFDRVHQLAVIDTYERDPSGLSTSEVLARAKPLGHLRVDSLIVKDLPQAHRCWLHLIKRMDLRSFESLKISGVTVWPYDELKPLLQDVGAWMRHLDISLGNVSSTHADSLGDELGLSYCTHLEEFTIRVFAPLHNRNRPTWQQLCDLLDSLRAYPSLRRLTIGYDMHGPIHDSSTDWDALRSVLQKFNNLESVVFAHSPHPPEWLVSSQETIRARLASLGAQVRVHVLEEFPPSEYDHPQILRNKY